MLDKFLNSFQITEKGNFNEDHDLYKDMPANFYKLLLTFGGDTFGNGIYRIHSFSSSLQWSIKISDYFKDYKNRIYPFGFDWLGRHYCLSKESETIILMFDPESGEAFNIKSEIVLLHDEEFTNKEDDLLSFSLFQTVLSNLKKEKIDYSECISLEIPLLLGGEEKVENYKIQNIEVYWELQKQIYYKIQDLPDGTKIGDIKLE